MNTAVGQDPSPKVLKAAKDAIPPDRGDYHLDPADSPPTLDPSLPASLVAAVGQHPFPKVLKAAKDAIPPDRGDGHLDFGSEGTENTNGARGDYGCGLSGAQATAQKAVFNQASRVDEDMATTFIYLSDHHPLCPCFPPDPFCPCPQSPPHPPEPLSLKHAPPSGGHAKKNVLYYLKK
jgi:hypothetical protein